MVSGTRGSLRDRFLQRGDFVALPLWPPAAVLILTRFHPQVVDGVRLFASMRFVMSPSVPERDGVAVDALPPLRSAPGCHRGSFAHMRRRQQR